LTATPPKSTNKHDMTNQLEISIRDFFHDFASDILLQAHADSNDPQAVKMALLDHFEEIYPRFAKTEVFKQCFEKEDHELMVEAYKKNFTLLLQGHLP